MTDRSAIITAALLPQMLTRSYALITAAYNEEKHIEKTISSVVSETLLPIAWIIVSDGSTDRTDEIVRQYAREWPLIELLPLEAHHKHDFGSKVRALNLGYERLRQMPLDFIGHLDADVSFGPSYFADLLERFDRNPNLGVAGGDIHEWIGTKYSPRRGNNIRSVAGAVQMFRRECYESLGGFLPLPYGGEDWCAEVTARMNGWQVQSFPDLPVYHHGAIGSLAGSLRRWYRGGLMDFTLGSHPLFEIARLARRLWSKPPVLGAFVRLCGFAWAACRGEKRIVSDQFVLYLRAEETARLRNFAFRRGWGSQPTHDSKVATPPLPKERTQV